MCLLLNRQMIKCMYESKKGQEIMYNEKILEFLKNHNGYITTAEIENIGFSKTQIPKLIEVGIIKKVAHGLYIDSNLIEDEFYILQKRFSNLVFSYNTACYLLNLSDRTPYELDVTTLKGRKIGEKVNIHYVGEDKFNIGIIEVTSPYGNQIKIYNAERCICDILKNPNSVDIELYNKIINNYFREKHKDLSTLEKYTKIFNVHKKFQHIMEVLI